MNLLEEFEQYKKTGILEKPIAPVVEKPEEGWLTKAARFVLPESLEYKFGITPKPEVEKPKIKSLLEE